MYLFIILTCASLILFLFTPSYISLRASKGRTPAIVALKALSTAIALVFGILGVVRCYSPMSRLIILGLFLGMLGDILLEYIVPLGGLAFGLGNLIYIYVLVKKVEVQWYHFILLLLILLLTDRLFGSKIKNLGTGWPFVIPYGVLVAWMASLSISRMVSKSTSASLFGFGTFLFALSDGLLAYRTIHGIRKGFHTISLSIYYMAQLCIGLSIYFC